MTRDHGKTRLAAALMLALPIGALGVTIALAGPQKKARPHAQGSYPFPKPQINSPVVPADVDIPSDFPSDENGVQFFDDYSWRAFIAVVWPTETGQRGTPDPAKTVDSAGPRVFETYKSIWEIFHTDGSTPAPGWNQYDSAKYNPLGRTEGFGDITLASFSHFAEYGQAGGQKPQSVPPVADLVGPLIAQNKTYVRFMTGFDKIEFNKIVPNKLYIRKNQASGVTFPDGAIDIKSSWMEMAGVPHPERFYIRMAWVRNPATGKTEQIKVGLVGLHIAQKTRSRPQWIWSSFEQVDCVPSPSPQITGPFSFNNGTAEAMPRKNPYKVANLPIPIPSPFNVTRTTPISSSTDKTNALYQHALSARNPKSVWQYYKLVMTQWPTPGKEPANPGDPAHTIPGVPQFTPYTAFANTTMETFDQAKIQTGCMNCHTNTQTETDFLWTLTDHAYPPVIMSPQLMSPQLLSAAPHSPAAKLSKLRALLQSGESHN